jgi:Arc/MetJ-type ribon-helix-helix transcriptional regulator
MQKVKDGYRASFRLNEDNSEHMEIYQMFQELMNSGKYRNESDLYRAAIASFYREKQGNGIADERKAELQECARMSANEVRELVKDIINTAVADLKTSAISIVPADSDIPYTS